MTPRRWANRAALRIWIVMSIARIGIERRLLADQLLERAPGQVLHRDVVRPVERPAVVHADDVRVLEAGGRLRLAAEPLDEARILGEPLVEQLQRDLAAELLVLGQEHVGHPAGAQPRHDLVAARRRSCRGAPSVGHYPPFASRPGARPSRSERRPCRRSRRWTRRPSPRSRPSDGRPARTPTNAGWVRFEPLATDLRRSGLAGDADSRRAGRRCRSLPRPPSPSSSSLPRRSRASSRGCRRSGWSS